MDWLPVVNDHVRWALTTSSVVSVSTEYATMLTFTLPGEDVIKMSTFADEEIFVMTRDGIIFRQMIAETDCLFTTMIEVTIS